MSIHVEIRYKLRQSDQIHVRVFTPEEYFDPLAPGESFEHEGDPKHMHNHKYLDIDASELEWSECIRRGAMRDSTLRVEYLKDGWLSHSASTPDAPELLILRSWLPDGAEHCVRMRRLSQAHPWKVEHNYLDLPRPDGAVEMLDLEATD